MVLRSLSREVKWICGDLLRNSVRFASTTSSGGRSSTSVTIDYACPSVFDIWLSVTLSWVDPEKVRLQGKVAMITGGASGLGRAAASEFIQHGAQVIIADVDSQQGPQVAKFLGPQAQFVCCDVSVEAQVAEAVDTAMASHGKLDIMFNNAGIAGKAIPPGIADLDLAEFDRVMGVNVRGAIAGIKHAARVMIPVGSGSILCTASISGLMGGLGPHPYSISKFAIPGIVKAISYELCQYGLGSIIAKIVNGLGELKGTKCEESDIAHAALYLASDEAKYVTGHNLVVDGGFTCFKTLGFPSPDQVV
ncbi:Short-chain dehydrogenase reductase 2a [Vitis vinifera]|uniref:Short-chain dehydrogenase reductase 2a n=1 Tax=Vitis vinifera TaxID=29760 RepID=A0A438JD90_VITVI|nr:Short-chain dehydrogenase reductase 2a [Vitis vinifera]